MTHALVVLAHAPPIAWLIVAGLFVAWRIDMEFHPFGRCRRCRGSGQNRGSRTDAFGICAHGQRRARLTGRRAAQRHLRRRGM